MSNAGRKKRSQEDIEALLAPGSGARIYEQVRRDGPAATSARRLRYALLSSMSCAIRERAADHSRSAERADTPIASAVSGVVKPAK